jgi:hypothetical protein
MTKSELLSEDRKIEEAIKKIYLEREKTETYLEYEKKIKTKSHYYSQVAYVVEAMVERKKIIKREIDKLTERRSYSEIGKTGYCNWREIDKIRSREY